MIPDALWQRYGARVVHLAKGETLFDQGTTASSFHQVKSGRVKMVSYNEQGREFVQGMFTEGQSFGEPPFFNDVPYPAAAIAVVDSEVWTCGREGFLRLLAEHPAIHLELTKVLSGRLVYKSMMLAEIAVEEAEHRLGTLIEYLRTTDPAGPGRALPGAVHAAAAGRHDRPAGRNRRAVDQGDGARRRAGDRGREDPVARRARHDSPRTGRLTSNSDRLERTPNHAGQSDHHSRHRRRRLPRRVRLPAARHRLLLRRQPAGRRRLPRDRRRPPRGAGRARRGAPAPSDPGVPRFNTWELDLPGRLHRQQPPRATCARPSRRFGAHTRKVADVHGERHPEVVAIAEQFETRRRRT